MGSKLRGDGVEFPDQTLQTTAAKPLQFLSTPYVINLTDYNNLPNANSSSGSPIQDSNGNIYWKRLEYSSINENIPDGAALYVRILGYTWDNNWKTFIHLSIGSDDSSTSADAPPTLQDNGFYWAWSHGANDGAASGISFAKTSATMEGYMIPKDGISATTNSILLAKGHLFGQIVPHHEDDFDFLNIIVLGWVKVA